MFTIDTRNVNRALRLGAQLLVSQGVRRTSRNGDTLEVPEPVATVYRLPMERVLFSQARDANPFFHFFEALWMLAGRHDTAFVAALVPRMKEFSDNGVTQHGAYGFRWRNHFERDQILDIVEELKVAPDSRRAVLTMWDPGVDGVGKSLDFPCNTHVYFKIRAESLLMTVCNRSNDMLWGAYGANVVHMSMMQEYVADKLNVNVGAYTQISDSFHIYLPPHPGGEVWERVQKECYTTPVDDPYHAGEVETIPMRAGSPGWEEDLEKFFRLFGMHGTDFLCADAVFKTFWWCEVAGPMWDAWKTRNVEIAKKIAASDWRMAAMQWLERRER